MPVFMKLPNRRPNSVGFLFLGCLGGLTSSLAAGGVSAGAGTPCERRASPGNAALRAAAPGVDDTALGGSFGAATGTGGAAGAGRSSVAGGAAAEMGTDAPTAGRSFSAGPCSCLSRLWCSRERRFPSGRTTGAVTMSLLRAALYSAPASCLRLPRPPRLAQATPGQQQQTCLDGCSSSTLSSEDDSDDDDAHSHRSRLLGRLSVDWRGTIAGRGPPSAS
jgi:hypothetical protein